jgi:hypothetical protein
LSSGQTVILGLEKENRKQYRLYFIYPYFYWQFAAMAIVLVIIRVHRSSILSFRSKVVVEMVVVVAAVVVMFVVPFFLSLSLCLFRSISRLVCVLFLFFSSSVRSLELRRILKWYYYYNDDHYCCCSRVVRQMFFFREQFAVFSFLSLFCMSFSRSNALFDTKNNLKKEKEDDRKTKAC